MAVSRINEAGLNVNQYGNRNLVINGAMQVAQRGTSFTGLGADGENYNLDRFVTFASSTAGRATITQDADSPDGLANSLKIACTTADTSVAAGEIFFLQHRIEGQDLQRFAKGTSAAKEYTVSFYVKGNASATYVCELYDVDNDRHVAKTFSVTTGWTRVELTFPADTTGAFGDDNGRSLDLTIWLHAGSTYTGGTLPSTWAAKVNANRAVGATTSIFDSTSRTFFITGLQMEVGDTATDFEHRTFGDELQRCQRYCQRHPSQDQADGGNYSLLGAAGWASSTTNANVPMQLPTTMRLEPTATFSGNWRILHTNTASTVSSGPTINDSYCSVSAVYMQATCSASLTAGQGAAINANNDTDAHVILDAEL